MYFIKSVPPQLNRTGSSRIDTFAKIFLLSNVLPNPNVAVDAVYRSDWGRIVATLIRQFGDFELAEDAAQDAFAAAVDQWRTDGIPESPRAWIIQTAKHKAIDRLRRQTRLQEKLEADPDFSSEPIVEAPNLDDFGEIPDDRLRLIFTCCHPALSLEAQVALTLRTLGGLQTDEIARAFLVQTATMAQRLGPDSSSPPFSNRSLPLKRLRSSSSCCFMTHDAKRDSTNKAIWLSSKS